MLSVSEGPFPALPQISRRVSQEVYGATRRTPAAFPCRPFAARRRYPPSLRASGNVFSPFRSRITTLHALPSGPPANVLQGRPLTSPLTLSPTSSHPWTPGSVDRDHHSGVCWNFLCCVESRAQSEEMSQSLVQPVGQKRLTNVAVVRQKKHGLTTAAVSIRRFTGLKSGTIAPAGKAAVAPVRHTAPAWRSTLWEIVGRIKWFGFGVLLIYVVTLSIFPRYITQDVQPSAVHGDWYPILLIAAYNVFDLLGKCLPVVHMLHDENVAVAGCVARLLFLPLFLVCLHGPGFFRREIPVMVLTCLLGLSNGYLTGVLMILAPKAVPLQHVETAGIAIVLFLIVGLAIGSVVSWFWII